jgi:RHS repeat-associated protein
MAATADPVRLATATSSAALMTGKQKGPRREGQLLVRFRQDVTEQQKNALVGERGARRSKSLKGKSRVEKLELQQGADMDAVAAELRANPAVELVEPNFLISRDQVTTPGDPRFTEQWALSNTGATGGQPGADIQAMSAWETTKGAPTTIIAVVDSGIDFTHPDLRNNQWANNAEHENNKDDDNNGLMNDLHGWDWVTDSGVIRDGQGHGTAVAGIIAAEGNNSIGITGVMWRAGLMSLRVLDNTGTGEIADAVEAIDYAVEHGAQVINCSWGTDEESLVLKDAIERAGRAGVVVVSSAGNGGRDIDNQPYYPSSYGLSNQLVVASTDNFDNLASWSNYGPKSVTVAAPGKDILTTRVGGDYTVVTGTSASTPLVTGVVGLVKTQRWWLSAAGTRKAIADGARQVEGLKKKVFSGAVVSASGAFRALRGPNAPPPGTSNGNNGNNGNGGSNGNGNNNPSVRPPTPGHGSGGTGEDGGFSTTPPPVTQSIPGSPLPNLDEVRKRQPTIPKAPAPIRADLPCLDCDPGGGTPPPAGGSDPYFNTARTRPQNETGQPGTDLGSRNFNWSLPLVSLPGRAGLDLNLAITYNSLVWTKQGNSIMFNADRGFPGPGFMLGVPSLQARYINSDFSAGAYMLIMPSGGRVELRQVGTSNLYESQDSSYIEATDYGGAGSYVVVRTKDGTQYTFTYPPGVGAIRCTQIKDRNGNYLSIGYNANAQANAITDTLGRAVIFVYSGDYLSQIVQTWNGQTHVWATFGYGNVTMSTNFPGMSYLGPQGSITVLTQIGLADGTRYNFSYTSFAQIYKITHYAADQHPLSYTGYNLPGSDWLGLTAQSDCPRFTERRDWAENWNDDQAVITYYTVDPNSAAGEQPAWSQVTMPDGTIYKELYATAANWQKGLTTGTEVWAGGVKKKWTTADWTQDDTNLTYPKNPRIYETNIYDVDGNRKRSVTEYNGYPEWGLPSRIIEYEANGTTEKRHTFIGYNMNQAYLDRHIIGLVSAVHVSDTFTWHSIIYYSYDAGGPQLVATPSATVQHDNANYGTSEVSRGNLTSITRYDVYDIGNASKRSITETGYDTNGSVVFTKDPLNHQTSVSYVDSFSDGLNHSTFAYPTTVTDADNYPSTAQYNYDFGAVTHTQDPKGAAATMTYDAAGRPDRVTNQVNGAYTRYVYNPYGDVVTFSTIKANAAEAFSDTYFDGAGRFRSIATDNPNSTGGYAGRYTLYDVMGRPSQTSNPSEMNLNWTLAGDDTAGWVVTQQAYDWKGRPTITTNPDGTTMEAAYGGCGCAGGEVVTTRDERGRRKRMTMDVFGRLKKVEELNWDQSVYATTDYAYNARDQITSISQPGLSNRTFEYDGHGRLWKRTTPEQGLTTYAYNADDTVQSVTDARGASATYGYNNRHLVTGVTYGVPSGVAATANVSYGYDEAGNRTSMTDGLGYVTYNYDTLSRLKWEERVFSNFGTYRLSYDYDLAGNLKSVTNPWGVEVGYTLDQTGRTTAVTGAGYRGVSSYVNNLTYRAFGGAKQIAYANGRTLSVGYDNRLRMASWDVAGVMGSAYVYDTPLIHEKTGRVAYADNLYDSTLDRSFDYDQVGRLVASHTGIEGSGHAGYTAWGAPNGPYAQNYSYDSLGNITWRNGWGAPNSQYAINPNFSNNKLTVNPVTGAAMQYDAAGNLVNDGQQTFAYDATGQQTYALGTSLSQAYDGDGVRVRKTENNSTTYYVRSSVLGKQVIAEINGSGTWQRGYVYLGGQLLAVQDDGVYWTHQDPVTKSQRMTNTSGTVVSWVEMDPWGGETGRSSNSQLQHHKFTSYERDANSSDDAMFRRYEGKWQRFAQPDPYDGSYNFSDPQSLNRYAYVQNDPVNFFDPSGLCTFNINISGASGQTLTDMQNEIARIFRSGNHRALFGAGPALANGGSMNITVVAQFTAVATNWLDQLGVEAPYAGVAGVTLPNSRYAEVNTTNIDRESNMFLSFGAAKASYGTQYGRVASHEAIQHGFLGIKPEGTETDITRSAQDGSLTDAVTDRWNISKKTAAALDNLCLSPIEQRPLNIITNPGLLRPYTGGGSGGGGGFRRGGGDPFDSFRWLDLRYAMERREWEQRQRR